VQAAVSRGFLSSSEINDKIVEVYRLMALSVLISTGFAYMVLSSPSFMGAMKGGLMWVVLIAQLALVFGMGFMANKLSAPALTGALYAVSALFGLSLAPIVDIYTSASVVQSFALAAIVFCSAALVGYFTKKSLAGMGSFLMVGMIGILLAGIANIFFQSSAAQFAINVLTVVVFTGLAAYDSQRIRDDLINSDGVQADKIVVMGALSMYLNMLNIFTALLRLLGVTSDD
jgi:FtsH-binding integral membrane protein